MAFNKGDRVAVRDNIPAYWFFKPGDIGTVVNIFGTDDYGIEVKFDEHDGEIGCVDVDQIIPLVTNGPTVLPAKGVRTFGTGATRDTDEGKLDFEGFLSPIVLEAFAEYMHEKRKMPDGSLRDSDNWQKGIPVEAYMKSMFRHFIAVWKSYRAGKVSKEDLLALFFNVQGLAHETLRAE